MAKLLDHQDSHVTTAVRGTVGHIAPEYLSTGQSSEKTDVFGFGILLLELITGQRALEFGKAANQKGGILDWVSSTIEKQYKSLMFYNGPSPPLADIVLFGLSFRVFPPSARERFPHPYKGCFILVPNQCGILQSTPLRGLAFSLALVCPPPLVLSLATHRPVSGFDTICNRPNPPLADLVLFGLSLLSSSQGF